MPTELDSALEDAARDRLTRLIDAIEVEPPERPPWEEAGPQLAVVADIDRARSRPSRRSRRVVVLTAAAGLVVAAAAAVLLTDDRGEVETDPATPVPERPTTTEVPTTTSTTSTTVEGTATTAPDAAPSPAPTEEGSDDPASEPGGDREVRRGFRPPETLAALDAATSPVPLDQLVDVATATTAGGSGVTLQAGMAGDDVALQLAVPGQTGYPQGLSGWRIALAQYWMVSTVGRQHVVWGLGGSGMTEVTVITSAGDVTAPTVPIGPPGSGESAFVALLPEGALVTNVMGTTGDGYIVSGDDVERSLASKSTFGPEQQRSTAFVPRKVH